MSESNSQRGPAKPDAVDPVDVGDPDQVKARKDKAKLADTARIMGLKSICADPNARAWLRDVLDFCGIHRTSFTGNSTTFFNEGARNVGLKIQADLVKHCPDALITIMKEGTQ